MQFRRNSFLPAAGLRHAARPCAHPQFYGGGYSNHEPGVRSVETINPPQFRQMLAGLPIGRASPPLPTPEGIMVVMVCSKEQKNLALASPQDLRASILRDRVEQQSRRLMRDLRRRANISQRV